MPELTNLLSHDRIKSLSRDYVFRLATLVGVAAVFVVFVHGMLLFPSYVYLSEEVKTRKAHLDSLVASLEASEERAAGERLGTLIQEAGRVTGATKSPSAASVLRVLFEVPRGGVRVTGITLSPPESGEGQMRVRGIAPTRDSLRRYYDAVSKLPFVSRAELPLSVYAEERDISFSITITGPLQP